MRPDQVWLDLSTPRLRVWADAQLGLAHKKAGSAQRLGFFRDIPLYTLPTASAHTQGWTSFPWEDMQGRFHFEEDFWLALEAARWPLLEEQINAAEPPFRMDPPLATELLFFGGTFDPWHEGHQACLDLAPTHMPLLLCPDRSPQKQLRTKQALVESHLLMRKQVRPTAQTIFYPGFLLLEQSNPTVGWLLRAKKRRPDLRLHLLMGHDSFASLPTWVQATELLKLVAGFWVVPRLENNEERARALTWVESRSGPSVTFLANHPHEAQSSSKLREK